MNEDTKVSVRISTKDKQAIERRLKEFGCASLSDFFRLAAVEKMERLTVGSLVKDIHDRQLEALAKIEDAAAVHAKFVEESRDREKTLIGGFRAIFHYIRTGKLPDEMNKKG